MKKNKFNPGTRITIFFVFFAALFFALGLWQIERGQSKTILLDEFEKNSITNPKYISKDSKKWDRVFFEGTWEGSNQILVDNVINRGVAGYKVLTPFRISETERMILIDRGWLKRNTDIGATINRASNGEGIIFVILFGVMKTIAIVINDTPIAAPLILVSCSTIFPPNKPEPSTILIFGLN